MENENKNPRPQGEQNNHKHHHRPHKKRSYFIEPAGGDDKKSAPPKEAPSEKKKEERAEKPARPEQPEKKNNAPSEQGEKNRHKRHKRHKKPHTDNAEKAQNQQPQAQKKEERVADPSKPSHESRNGGRDRSRSRHGKQNRTNDVLTPMPVPQKSVPHLEAEDEYEVIQLPEPEQVSVTKDAETEENVPMVEVVGIRFKNSGKTYYFAPGNNTVRKGQYAIVETARGREYGEVSMGNTMVKESDTVPPLRPIIRIATNVDREHHLANKQLEEDAFRICNEKIAEHGLDMKLIDAQYTFDNSKLLFYFTSAGRVDFRVLVKDLASVFRTRIELRQIGIRDEAKLMGGIGMCGRPLCCSTFLSDFGQVSIKMAKEQNLSLNSAKISGICGRLMCCLRYEHETYEYEIKRTPPVDSLVRTVDGNGTVTETNPLAGTLKVRLLATPDTPPKTYRRSEVVMIQKKKPNNSDKN